MTAKIFKRERRRSLLFHNAHSERVEFWIEHPFLIFWLYSLDSFSQQHFLNANIKRRIKTAMNEKWKKYQLFMSEEKKAKKASS